MKHKAIPLFVSAFVFSLASAALGAGGDNHERSLATIRDRSPASEAPRWQQDPKAFEELEAKKEDRRVKAESDTPEKPAFSKSPYLNYSR